jgi:DNA adenine methylase
MIYLNRTCFNGLYRVNKSGGFNVPIGDYTNPEICDADNLLASARALGDAQLVSADFASVTAAVRSGDFVYFDPPYMPTSETADFTSFTRDGFTLADQRRLAECARGLKEHGVHVLLSNADLPVVRKLYEGFEMRVVTARRAINSKGGRRGPVGELLIW